MMKKIISALTAALLLMTALCISVGAAGAESITSVDIAAVLNSDGKVHVSETWTIEYPAAATGFTRNFEVYGGAGGLTPLQSYDSLESMSVTVNGSPVDSSRFTAAESFDKKSFNVDVKNPCLPGETVTYGFSYIIEGGLKKVKGNANFTFVFIGDSFPLTCNNVKLTLTAPEGIKGEDIKETIEEGNNAALDSRGENSIVFSARRVYNTFAVSVSMPDSPFADGALSSYSSAAQSLNALSAHAGTIAAVAIFLIASVALILFVLCKDRLLRMGLERKAVKGMTAEALEAANALPTEITPTVAYKALVPYSRVSPKSTSKKVPYLFALTVLECIEKRYIAVSGDKLIVGFPEKEESPYILSALNFFKTFGKKDGKRILIDKDFALNVSRECENNYDTMAKYLAAFYQTIPAKGRKFFKDEATADSYKAAYLLKIKATKHKSKETYSDMINAVLGGEKCGELRVFSMMFGSLTAQKFFSCGSKDCVSALSDSLYAMYKVFVKSK